MNRTGATEKARVLVALVFAAAGSAAEAHVADKLGGADGAAYLEAAETERRQQRERERD